ncbi:transposase [Frankia nepalensis]
MLSPVPACGCGCGCGWTVELAGRGEQRVGNRDGHGADGGAPAGSATGPQTTCTSIRRPWRLPRLRSPGDRPIGRQRSARPDRDPGDDRAVRHRDGLSGLSSPSVPGAGRAQRHGPARPAPGARGLLPRPPAPHGSGLGRQRWPVERTVGWLHQFRRLRTRWERRADIHQALLTSAARSSVYVD